VNNKYEIRGDTTAIFLNRKGEVIETLISTRRLDRAQEHTGSWHPKWTPSTKSYYVQGDFWKNNERQRVMLHRWILDAPDHLHVDHINHDTLINLDENLRLVTVMENHQNQLGLNAHNTSGVRNVYWDKSRNKWCAEIIAYRKKIYLGRYDDLSEAGKVVEEARSKLMPFSQEALAEMDVKEFLFPHLSRARSDNKTSGHRNVYWNNVQNRWQVRISKNGKEHSFGYYDDLEEAAKVAETARKTLKGS
jgi:hypothetical protein